MQIKAGREAEAIEYGRTHVVPLLDAPAGGGSGSGGSSSSAAPADRELLEDATALLAYDDPATGPTGGCCGTGWVSWQVLGAAAFVERRNSCRVLGHPAPAPRPALLPQTSCMCCALASHVYPFPLFPFPPTGYMLLPGHRSELAAALNRAILVHSGRSEDSALEAILRQATAALQVGAAGGCRSGVGSSDGRQPQQQQRGRPASAAG